jgi:hypothetical protein
MTNDSFYLTKGQLVLIRQALVATVALLESIPRPSGHTRDLLLRTNSCIGIIDQHLIPSLATPETNVPEVETRPVRRSRR